MFGRIIAFLLFSISLSYAGDIPRIILHQGYLTDTNGNPVNGSVNISFGIYDVDTGGTPLLEEDVGAVNIKDGFYALEIGKNINLYSIFSDKYSLFLEVRINNEALSPRQRIGSVPFAFISYDAVGDIHPTSITIGGKRIINEEGKWIGDASSIPGVKSITALSPLTGGTITDIGNIGISKADNNTDGYLSKEDYAIFLGKQNRITGYCGVGSCIKKINEDGSVECDICGSSGGAVSISAGTGIVVDPNPIVGIGTISIDKTYFDNQYVLQGQPQSITEPMIVDGAITKEKLSDSGCVNGQILKFYESTKKWECASDEVGLNNISITGNNGIVVNPDPITSGGTISLSSGYIDGSVYDTRFVNENQPNSITSTMLVNGTILGEDIANSTITLSKLARSGCNNGQVVKYYMEQPGVGYFMCGADLGITSCNTCDTTFVNENQSNSITSSMIVDGTITNSDLSSGNYPNITGVGTLGSLTVSGNSYLATTSGNVGIGTTSPSEKLHIYKTNNSAGYTGIKLTYNFTGPVNGNRSSEWNINASSLNGSFEISNAGGTKIHINGGTDYVGIGTTSPMQKLDVSGNIRASGQLISSVATGTSPLSINSTTKVDNLNADMVDGWHAAVILSGTPENLYGVNTTNWVTLNTWAVDFDSIPGNTLRGLGYVSSSAGTIAGRIRFLINGSQVGNDCTFTATITEARLDCPVITYSKPTGIGQIRIEIRRDTTGSEYVYYGMNTLTLK